MTNFKIVLSMVLVVALLALPAVATSESPLRPGMGGEWLKSQGADVQSTVDYILGALVAVTLIAFLIFTILAWLGYAGNSGDMGDPHQKSNSSGKVMRVLCSLVGIVLFVNLGLRFSSWW